MTGFEPGATPPTGPPLVMGTMPPQPPLAGPPPGPRGSGSQAIVAAVLLGVIGLVVLAGFVVLGAAVLARSTSEGPVNASPVVAEQAPAPGSTVVPAAGVEGETAPVTITGDVLPPMPDTVSVSSDAAQDPAIGQTAPTLGGSGFAGDEITIPADGRPKAIYFVAHWCPHCQAEVPRIQDLIDTGAKPENLDIYVVSTSVQPDRGNYPVSAWLEREGFTPPVIRDDSDGSAHQAFGGGGFPYAVYLDGDNKVVARSAGELGSDAIAILWTLTAAS